MPTLYARKLAEAFVAGGFDSASLQARGRAVVANPGRWHKPLCQHLERAYGHDRRPSVDEVALVIDAFPAFRNVIKIGKVKFNPRKTEVRREMAPAAGPPSEWMPYPLVSRRDVLQWLNVSSPELDWFVDARGQQTQLAGKLCHYRYRWVRKRSHRVRLIEAPKARLKFMQRLVLRDIFAEVPAHPAAHGFCPGRGVSTFVTPHVGKAMVIKFDLANFFPSISKARIVALLTTLGYPHLIVQLLAGLVTHRTSTTAWDTFPTDLQLPARFESERLYRPPHLPQGAPTSPALANLAAWRLDHRLSCWAKSAGATYTRYADDLLFSGGKELKETARSFARTVVHIVSEEGFRHRPEKTRIMSQATRQIACGVVLNKRAGIPRKEFDRLKAILYRCQTGDPALENRDNHPNFKAHLLGRIGYVGSLHPNRGDKLTALFEKIEW